MLELRAVLFLENLQRGVEGVRFNPLIAQFRATNLADQPVDVKAANERKSFRKNCAIKLFKCVVLEAQKCVMRI
jgi:hypothetical protein